MAARLNNRHQQSVKDKIQASQLVNLLQKHALDGTDLLPTRIDAAKFLLNKMISNAPQDVNVGGQEDNPLVSKIQVELVDIK